MAQLATTSEATITRNIKPYVAAFVVCLIFLAINLALGTRAPMPWCDECAFVEPGISLAQGQGLTTSLWGGAQRQFMWYQVPLFSAMEAIWTRTFGIGLLQARSLNYVLASAAAMLLTATALRLGLIQRTRWAVLLACLLLASGDIQYSYRSARYDTLGYFLCSCLAMAFTLRAALPRLLILFAIAMLVPFGNLPALPLVFGFLATLLIVYRQQVRREVLAVGAGIACGGILLLVFFAMFGELTRFLAEVHRKAGEQPHKLAGLVGTLRADRASVAIMALLVILAVFVRPKSLSSRRSPVVIGLLATLIANLCVNYLGAYHFWIYAWMFWAPLAVCTVAAVSALPRSFWRRPLGWACTAILAYSMMAFPAFMVLVCRESTNRDYHRVDALVTAVVRPGDTVLCDDRAYFPVKRIAHEIYCDYGDARGGMAPLAVSVPPAVYESIDLMIIRPDFLADREAAVGGNWQLVATLAPVGALVGQEPRTALQRVADVFLRLAYPHKLGSGQRIPQEILYNFVAVRRASKPQ